MESGEPSRHGGIGEGGRWGQKVPSRMSEMGRVHSGIKEQLGRHLAYLMNKRCQQCFNQCPASPISRVV